MFCVINNLEIKKDCVGQWNKIFKKPIRAKASRLDTAVYVSLSTQLQYAFKETGLTKRLSSRNSDSSPRSLIENSIPS
jgi:hypothetical protein